MSAWILIAYMSFGTNGGPVATEFFDRAACQSAVEAMKADRALGARLMGAICVPKEVPHG